MKIESFPRKLFLFRNNLCMFAQTQNELHNMKHMSILAVSLLALVACTPEKKQEADYSQYVNPMIGTDFTGNTYRYGGRRFIRYLFYARDPSL